MNNSRDAVRIELRTSSGETLSLRIGEALDLAVNLHRFRHDFATAERLYRAVLEIDPDEPRATQFLGVLMAQTERHAEAVPLLRRTAALTPNDPGCWNNLGNVLFKSGDPTAAAEAYRKAIALAPGNAQPHSNLGVVLHLCGHPEAAEAALREAITLDPKFDHAWYRLGKLLGATGRYDEAVDAFLTAVTLAPDQYYQNFLAEAYVKLGQIDKARETYQSWCAAEPDNPIPRHLLKAYGEDVPARCPDGFVTEIFDRFANDFEARLKALDYRAPDLVSKRMEALDGAGEGTLAILDAGCGTGWCAPFLRAYASRLVGVDLSPKMVEFAERTALYDELAVGELTDYLAGQTSAFDRIVVCDTLCYFGDLAPFARAARAALTPGGVVIATFEALLNGADQGGGYLLRYNGRYEHAGAYVDRIFRRAGFEVVRRDTETLRREWGRPVTGFVLVARRTPEPGATGR